MKQKLLVLIACLAVIFGITAPLIFRGIRQRAELQKTFAGYRDALVRTDFKKAYSYGSSEFRDALPYDQFAHQQQTLVDSFGPLRAIIARYSVVHGHGDPLQWTAQIEADLEYSSRTVSAVLEFHYEGGHWVVHGYKINGLS